MGGQAGKVRFTHVKIRRGAAGYFRQPAGGQRIGLGPGRIKERGAGQFARGIERNGLLVDELRTRLTPHRRQTVFGPSEGFPDPQLRRRRRPHRLKLDFKRLAQDWVMGFVFE